MGSVFKICVGLCVALMVSACAAPNSASRAAPPDDVVLSFAPPDYRVDSFTVSVPRSLSVNERNLYYPRGDIVWRGEPLGDRHAQVEAIFSQAMRNAMPYAQGTRPVRVDLQVARFHGVSEKSRYTVGGIHDITFRIRIADARTGAVIAPSKLVDADLEALAGFKATEAEARGEGQKVRVTRHLTNVLAQELTRAGGYQNRALGLLQRINDL